MRTDNLRETLGLTVSYALLLWAILTAPLLISSTISDLLGVFGTLKTPVRAYRDNVDALIRALGIENSWPQWGTDLFILITLAGTIFGMYLVRIGSEAARQLRAAEAGHAVLVKPQPITSDVVDATLGTTAIGGVVVATATGKMMLATGAALAGTGPIGWVIGPFVLAGIAVWGMEERNKRRKAAAEEHAQEETARLAREQTIIAYLNVEEFKRKETRKLVIASAIVIGLVAANFLLELLPDSIPNLA